MYRRDMLRLAASAVTLATPHIARAQRERQNTGNEKHRESLSKHCVTSFESFGGAGRSGVACEYFAGMPVEPGFGDFDSWSGREVSQSVEVALPWSGRLSAHSDRTS